jgi:hypothetical protein
LPQILALLEQRPFAMFPEKSTQTYNSPIEARILAEDKQQFVLWMMQLVDSFT